MQIQMEMEHQDGIIFADFKNGGSGSWGTTYTISTVTGLKEYYVSKTNYNGSFEIKDVLSARRSGNARFNVMAFSSTATTSTNPLCVWLGLSDFVKKLEIRKCVM